MQAAANNRTWNERKTDNSCALIDYCYKQTDSVGGLHSGNIGVKIYIEKVKATIAYSKYKKTINLTS